MDAINFQCSGWGQDLYRSIYNENSPMKSQAITAGIGGISHVLSGASFAGVGYGTVEFVKWLKNKKEINNMEDNKLENVQKDDKIEKIQENKTDDVSGGKFDDEPVLICHFCGKKFPMDKVVICPFGACCDECRMKGKK